MLLYKYLPLVWSGELSEREKELNYNRCLCIKNNTFWFSTPKTLNDPYDCKPFFKNINQVEDIRLILQDLNEEETNFILKHYPNSRTKDDIVELHRRLFGYEASKRLSEYFFQRLAATIVNSKIRNVGILCLTTDYANILMWSHYAKNHEGICIEIEMPEDTRGLREVVYTSIQPSLMIYEGNHGKYGRLADIFYTKSNSWDYEKEWRIVAHIGDETKAIPGTTTTRIIYGLNTSETTKRRVAEIIGKNIETYQMTMKRNYLLH